MQWHFFRSAIKKPLWRICCGFFSLAIVLLTWGSPHFLTAAQPPPTPNPITELRGVWLTNVGSSVLFLPWGVQRAMRQLAELNFNTVYPVVWNRGHTFYPSPAAQRVVGRMRDPLLSMLHPGQDVLAKIVHQGNRHHLRVIPWFEYGFIAPLNSALAQQHPNWLTWQQNGDRFLSTDNEGLPSLTGWLNPFHPQVQRFMLDMITEVVSQYDVDGIQFDDHFGLPVQFGYDFYTVQLYRQDHQGQDPPANTTDPEWVRWRADQLTKFMQQVYQTVKAIKPDCLVTLSPNSQGFSYWHYSQDWQTWVAQGWIDELVLQVYRQDLTQFQTELNQGAVQQAKQQIPVAIGIHTGNGKQPTPFTQIREQVEAARSQGFQGVSFFYWESLWGYLTPESPYERRASFRDLFS